MIRRRGLTVGLALCGLALLAAACTIATPTVEPGEPEMTETATLPEGDAERGQYIFGLAWGCGCHNSEAGTLAGGNSFGPVQSRNITPDAETGIGDWTDQQIADAIRLGKRPDGRQLAPSMPYRFFSGMADQDVADLIAYLRSVPAVSNEIPDPELSEPFPAFEPAAPPPAVAPTEGVERGEYIVSALARCSSCHSGRTEDGTVLYLAGNYNANTGVIFPNITPHEETGIGLWTEDDIVTLLHTGVRPDGNAVLAPMSNVLNGGVNQITTDDALAVAAYLKSIPPVENTPGP